MNIDMKQRSMKRMFENFKWINEGEIKIEENKVIIKAHGFDRFLLWRKYH